MASAVGKTGAAYARVWHLVDARGQILGNLARGLATTLAGQHKPVWTQSRDSGDYVVVVNAREVVVSGNKRETKLYRHHTGYPGGLKEYTFNQLMASKPDTILRRAVYGMLPKDKLRRDRIDRLKIFADDQHPYAQNIIRRYEDPDLNTITPKEWCETSGEQLLSDHDERQRRRVEALLREVEVEGAKKQEEEEKA